MQNSKIYSILKHFNKYEQNRLRKYIVSPYFNKNEAITQLFELFVDHINAESEDDLEKEVLWDKINHKADYDDVRFRKLCSDLLKLVERFLAQQVYEENPLHQATYLIAAVGKLKLEKLYNSSMKTARRLSNQQLYKPANFYFYQHQVEKNYYELEESELRRERKTNYEAIIKNLDYFYLAEKLRWYTSIVSRQSVVNYQYELLFIEELIDHVKNYQYDNIPQIAIYYQIYLTQTEAENEEHYFKLKELLENHGQEFPSHEANEIYSHAINYCIKMINKGNQHFLEEFIQINEDFLKKGILKDGEFSPWKFQNIVITALRLEKYNWTKSFIHTYKNKLPESYQENAVTFNIARLYFYQKKFDKVIELLREVEYDDISYNLGSKAMLLITYYETDEIEPLYFLMESFRTYLNRHKEIPANRRQNYTNLIRFLKILTKTLPGDKKGIEKLSQELEKMDGIAADKNWLNEKIAELE